MGVSEKVEELRLRNWAFRDVEAAPETVMIVVFPAVIGDVAISDACRACDLVRRNLGVEDGNGKAETAEPSNQLVA